MTDKQDTSKHPFLSAVLGAVSPTNILTEYFSCFRGYQKTKAYLLSWLDNWIYLKLKQGKPPWVYVVCQQIASDIGCCRDTAHRNLKELCDMGILKRLPYKRWATDNIWQYTIDCDRLGNHLFSSFTRAISKSASLGLLWIRYLSDAGNQTSVCQKSDFRLSEIRQPDALYQATNTSASLDLLDPPTSNGSGEEKKEDAREIKDAIASAPFMLEEQEIKDAIASSPFMQDEETRAQGAGGAQGAELKKPFGNFNSSQAIKLESNNSQITIFHRLRDLGISDYSKVRSLVKQTPRLQLESNIQALEELAATKGLKNPIAAFNASIKDNWQPKNDKQSWWSAAAAALGRERRDRLITYVTEFDRVLVVCFANGKQLPFDEAKAMDWDALAVLGGET